MKLTINAVCCVDGETLKRNTSISEGWPEPQGTGRLAVVGGGPSIAQHIPVLREWPGDVWAINGAYFWCREHGIKARLYSVDPESLLAEYTAKAESSVIAAHCAPTAFEGPNVTCAKGDYPGPTSATAAVLIAINAGYSGVTFFGCESSYANRTHAYENQAEPLLLQIECNGERFYTKPDLILQAQVLAKFIDAAPSVYSEESGGLLRAMSRGTDFEAIAGTKHFHDTMTIVEVTS